MMNLEIRKPILSIDAKNSYLYSFLLVFGLTLICALLAGSSYRSEREKQEAAEQRRIQELHNEFLTQKD